MLNGIRGTGGYMDTSVRCTICWAEIPDEYDVGWNVVCNSAECLEIVAYREAIMRIREDLDLLGLLTDRKQAEVRDDDGDGG